MSEPDYRGRDALDRLFGLLRDEPVPVIVLGVVIPLPDRLFAILIAMDAAGAAGGVREGAAAGRAGAAGAAWEGSLSSERLRERLRERLSSSSAGSVGDVVAVLAVADTEREVASGLPERRGCGTFAAASTSVVACQVKK